MGEIVNMADIKPDEVSAEEVHMEDNQVIEAADDVAIADPEHPLDAPSLEKITQLMKATAGMVNMMESAWKSEQDDFKLTADQINKAIIFNNNHLVDVPDDYDPIEHPDDNVDIFNGVDKMTDEDIEEIFGKEHLIIGVDHSQTIDRIKYCLQDYYNWRSALKEYSDVVSAYNQLVEAEEEKNVAQLRAYAESRTDPDVKRKLLRSLDEYYEAKYLDYMANPLSDKDKTQIWNGSHDEKKLDYWKNRFVDKMKRMGMSPAIAVELHGFEIAKMEEKYHKYQDVLCTYFLRMGAYCDPYSPGNMDAFKIRAASIMIDNYLHDRLNEKDAKRVLNNLKAFLDQFEEFCTE